MPETATVSGMTDQRFVGTIKTIDISTGFGSIDCPEVQDFHHVDVLFCQDQNVGVCIGDTVAFTYFLDNDGRPTAQALEVVKPKFGSGKFALRTNTSSIVEIPGVTDQWFVGTLAHFHHDKYFGAPLFGFIASPETQAIFSSDVFVNINFAKNIQKGDTVSFRVFIDSQGRPQGKDVDPLPHAANKIPNTLELDHFIGRVTTFDAVRNLGFITCPELQDLFGKDVFFHGAQHGFGIGDMVSFKATLHEHGLLQARKPVQAGLLDAANLSSSGRTWLHAASNLIGAACLPELNLEDRANFAWSDAVLKCTHPPLRDAIAAQSRPNLNALSVQVLANTLWSNAVLKFPNFPLSHAISSSARSLISGSKNVLKSQDLANLAWSAASIQFTHLPFRTALAAAALPKLSE